MSGVRVLIFAGPRAGAGSGTANAVGEGNAAELAEQLGARADVAAVEVLEASALRRGRRRRLGRVLPSALLGALGRSGAGLAESVNAFGPHVLVSFDAELTGRLGTLRAAGRCPVPLVGAAVDLHELGHLAGPGVDLYLLAWPLSRTDAEEITGAGRVAIVAAPIDSAFLEPPARGASRGWVARQAKLSLKGGRPLILIGGGAAGDGDLAGTAISAAQAAPDAAVLVLAGDSDAREAELTERLAEIEQIRVLGSSDRLATLLSAADVYVDTAGAGALEAAAVGCPVLSAGANLGTDLQNALEAERPEPVDVSTLASAADAVLSVATAH